MKNKFVKNIMEASIGAAFVGPAFSSIDSANMGNLGTMAKTSIGAGFAYKVSKKMF